jgi:hypothetical protein
MKKEKEKEKENITCPLLSFFATKSTFLVCYQTLVILKKYLRHAVTKHVNSFSVIVLLTKVHRQKL